MSGEHGGAGISSEEFKAILKERKLEKKEKAEEKREEGLKRIQEMNSPKSGLEPVQIFPIEIWQMILDEVGPEDRGNMEYLHKTFRGLMANHKIRDILLPQYPRLELNSQWKKYEEGENFEFHDFRVVTEFFKLREVSKSMKKRIDQLFEETLDKCLEDQFFFCALCELTLHLRFPRSSSAKTDELDRLLTNLKKGCSSRSICIDMSLYSRSSYDDDNMNFGDAFATFKHKISELLESVGEQMWCFEFDLWLASIATLEQAGLTVLQLYITLREWISLMPHLKWIKLRFGGFSTEFVPQQTVKSFASELEKLPFPKLDDLQRLDFQLDFKRNELFQICDAILVGNDHVPQLTFVTDMRMPDLTLFCNPRIRNLPLTHASFGYDQESRGRERVCGVTMTQLKSLLNPEWKLKQLKISVDAEDNSITSVFELLRHYPTLEKLELDISNVTIGDTEIPFLLLPNLQLFRLKLSVAGLDFTGGNIQFFFSLQFLLYCKDLRKIDWTYLVVCENKQKLLQLLRKYDPEEMISFGGGWNDLTRSNNLWTVFPSLETVHVDIDEMKINRKVLDVKIRNMYRVYERDCDSCPKYDKKPRHY